MRSQLLRRQTATDGTISTFGGARRDHHVRKAVTQTVSFTTGMPAQGVDPDIAPPGEQAVGAGRIGKLESAPAFFWCFTARK